jgi:hypothetical protein
MLHGRLSSDALQKRTISCPYQACKYGSSATYQQYEGTNQNPLDSCERHSEISEREHEREFLITAREGGGVLVVGTNQQTFK